MSQLFGVALLAWLLTWTNGDPLSQKVGPAGRGELGGTMAETTAPAGGPLRNWSGTYSYRAATIHQPRTVAELQSLVARGGSLHALGTRHSFNEVADATELISLAALEGEVGIDEDAATVSLPAGMRYGELAILLQRGGWALANLASLPHISVAGSVATATHGSGNANPSLASAVTGLSLVTGTGDLVHVERGAPDFIGAVVNLGALGVMTDLTLAIEPSFQIRQDVYERLPWEALTEEFEAVMAAGYSVSAVTDFLGDTVDMLWVKTRLTDGEPATMPRELFGAAAATEKLHLIRGTDPTHCTPQLGEPGAWCDRLPHFLLEYTPSSGAEIQSEYLMDRAHAPAAIEALRGLGGLIAPRLHCAEIRTVATDELWLSPAYRRDSFGIHFTWRPEPRAVAEAVGWIEAAIAAFDPRPHWGKVFGDGPDVVASYPRLADFRALADRYDPAGVFWNPYLARTIGR
jgi:xylitol oxidase